MPGTIFSPTDHEIAHCTCGSESQVRAS